MRSKKALLNSSAALVEQVVTVICGFILPRLILNTFGSSYNGISSSIIQFMNCAILLRAGIGGVTRAALYKPLAENDTEKISRIIKATQLFMKKLSVILSIILVVFAALYPFLLSDEFDWFFSFSLVIIIGVSTVVQNYFGITYLILVQADQRLYVYNTINIITTILNTIVAAVTIGYGANIHIVKLVSTFVYVLNPLVLNIYVSKRYHINKNVIPDHSAIKQRWDAFAQQAAAFVNNNTDVLVLTMFTNVKLVSVYTVYYMVAGGLCRVEQTLTNGIDAAFGNMMAKKEQVNLSKNFAVFEFIIFTTSTFIFTCGAILIEPFIAVYTYGVSDINYSRVFFGALMCLNQYLFCIRLPYQMVTEAAGHFKQNRNAAIIEAFLNISLSIIFVLYFDVIGVTIGTFVAMLFRTIQYVRYSSKNILHRKIILVMKYFVISFFEVLIIVVIILFLSKPVMNSYLSWCKYGIQVAIISGLIIFTLSCIFYRKEMKVLVEKIVKHKK